MPKGFSSKAQDDNLRWSACRVLAAFGERARPAVPALIRVLGDHDRSVRYEAVLALGAVGRGDQRAAAGLAGALRAPEREVRQEATRALWEADRSNPAIAAALGVQLLDWQPDEYLDLLGEATLELLAPLATGVFNPAGSRTVVRQLAFVPRLRFQIRLERQEAAELLGHLGVAARPALPALRLAAQDGDPVVRKAAAEALKKVEGSRP